MKAWPLILAAIGAGSALLWARAAGARVPAIGGQSTPPLVGNRPAAPAQSTRPAGPLNMSDEDVEYLARILAIEVGGAVGTPEGAGVAWVAYNRARQWGGTMRQVATGTCPGRREGWFGGGSPWIARVTTSPSTWTGYARNAYPQALTFARHFAQGEIPNAIGNRAHFSHPHGFQDCTQLGPMDGCPRQPGRACWICFDVLRLGLVDPQVRGYKRVPDWLTTDAMAIGEAIFAR